MMCRGLRLAGWASLSLLLALTGKGQASNMNCTLASGISDREQKVLNLLEPISNQDFSTSSTDGTYTYYFRICGDAHGAGSAGVVQEDSKSKKATVIGRYNSTQAFNGSDWVMLIYGGGDNYTSHCGKEQRRAMVLISCNRRVSAGNFEVMSEERDKARDCFYLFEMDSSYVCPETHLSIGSILLIVVFCFLCVYLVGGFLYQRLVVGAKGMEQFPNLSFWQGIGNLTADGCDFVCRSRAHEAPPTYRGVPTEPLGEEPEERDDHLLPM
nr:PREDICTED: cation-dependent mannose-6-phosphate receptor [Lepisosteus oculatus]